MPRELINQGSVDVRCGQSGRDRVSERVEDQLLVLQAELVAVATKPLRDRPAVLLIRTLLFEIVKQKCLGFRVRTLLDPAEKTQLDDLGVEWDCADRVRVLESIAAFVVDVEVPNACTLSQV